jgi:hypothetical protein
MSSCYLSIILREHRYAMHTHPIEAFGVAVEESVKAGCVTFALSTVGQAEIVNYPDLMFQSIEEAVEKVVAVLRDSKNDKMLREHLRGQAALFSPEAYMKGIRRAVSQFMGQRPG